MVVLLPSTRLSSQDLDSCNEPYIIDLSIGYSVAGFGLNGCGCSNEVDDCELINIIMRRTVNGVTELLECTDISLTERWWREEEDYVDIFNPITCEEYPESDTHRDRYEFNTSHLGLGDTLTILICKTDPYNDNLIELRAYPGESCKEYNCPPQLECPATFKLRKNLDCVYEIPDFTLGIVLTDTCQTSDMDVSEEYFIIQNPPAGTLIDDSIFVEITIEDQEREVVGSCDIYVTLAGDPPPEMDDPNPIEDIIHGDLMPEFQLLLAHDTMYDNSIIQVAVTTSIDEFTPAPCEGYQVKYVWSATDACANTITKERVFNVLPDVNDPIFASVPIDIDTIEAGQPLPILVDLVAVNGDGTTDGITLDKSIDPYEINLCQGYPVTYRWVATDLCDNKSELFKTFYVKAANAPPVFLESIIPINDITYGDPLPAPQDINAMTSSGDTVNIQVTHRIEPYVEKACEPYTVQYVWEAKDSCNNTATIRESFNVNPKEIDVADMFSMEDISLVIGNNCEQEAVIALPVIPEEYGTVGITYSVHDEQWKTIESFEGTQESAFVFETGTSFVTYSVFLECGTSFRDTIKVQAEDLQAPVIGCKDHVTLYVSDNIGCTAVANWAIPEALDNCGNPTIQQISGPNRGSNISTGIYEVKYQATDNFNNQDTCSFQLEVLPFKVEDFNCKSIEIDIDESCDAWVNLDTLLQENIFSCVSDLEASIIINQDTFRSPRLNLSKYRGQLIRYQICDQKTGICCGNSIILKDRIAPIVICADDVYVSCLFSAEAYRPELAAECGNVTWEYTEQGTSANCENDSVRTTLVRTFYAIDDEGNISDPCIQNIHILFAQLNTPLSNENLIFPPDTTISCNNYNLVSKTSDYIGIPMIGSVPILVSKENNCGINATYIDEIIVDQGCTKIVHREWTLSEPICQYGVNIQTHTQIIKVVDRTAPEVRLSKKSYTLGADGTTCQVEFPIPDITGIDNCDSDLEINIIHDGYWYNTNIPSLTLTSGINKLLIRVADDCNNYGFDTITIHVRDPIIPVAVCFENTNVAIPTNYASIYATDLDAGSYDNCELQKVEIKRSRTTCSIEDSKYKNHVTFCCEDIGHKVEIYLKVTDQSGNTNICSAMINVVDKTPPSLTIPPNLIIDCKIGLQKSNNQDPYGHIFGIPTVGSNQKLNIPAVYLLNASGELLSGEAIDNCPENLIITVDTEDNTNDCGIGTIKRNFVAIDGYGNKSDLKQQIIEVTGGLILDTNLITWPSLDTTIIECTTIRDINPDILGRPFIKEEPCALYGISHEDTYFSLVGDTDGACSKMTREWTVINWCDLDANMQVSRTQIIKLVDEIAPKIEFTSEELELYGDATDCSHVTIALTQAATDNCTSNTNLIWSLITNEDSDWEKTYENIRVDSNGWANTEITLPIGNHTIKWVVYDQCGNQTSSVQYIYVDTDKAPTPYATGLTTAISGSLEIEIKSSDLLAKAEHSCYDDIKISISRADENFAAASTSISFDCQDIGTNYINVYASRKLRNGTITFDYTTVTIEIQDNFEFCEISDSDTESDNDIIGSVVTSYGVVLSDANVFLEDMYTSVIEETTSDNTGFYFFPTTNKGRPYGINAIYDDILNNGLTTRDVIIIQQHLMGIKSFDSHWDIIQADVNQDQRVSSIDIVELRKTIIGQSSEMESYLPWSFFDADLSFDPRDFSLLDGLQHGVYIENMLTRSKEDLIGLKMGDMDHSAILSQDQSKSRSLEKHKLLIKDDIIKSGEVAEIGIYLKDAFTLGWQFELMGDDKMELIEATNTYKNNGLILIDGNTIISTVSQANPWQVNSSSPILILKVRALQDFSIKDALKLSNTSIRSEFYDRSLNTYQLEIEHLEEILDINVSNPSPNPFNATSTISINTPVKQDLRMKISDATGRILSEKVIPLSSGKNNIHLDRTTLPQLGLYFVHLNIGNETFTRRLIFTQ